jgi:hypothetical protein
MLDTMIHTLGLCGEAHPRLFDLVLFYSYIIENKNALTCALKNIW